MLVILDKLLMRCNLMSEENKTIRGKRRARRLVVQALYQWLMSVAPIYEIEAQFCAANDLERFDVGYFKYLLHGIVENLSQIEETFKPYLDRPIESLNPIELTVLRLSTFELLYCLDLQYKIILDEAVALTKTFGSQDGHKYVNGVLHHVSQKVRAVEINR
jgi:transcription antitermination protein NusB